MEERLRRLLDGVTAPAVARKILNIANVTYEDLTDEYGYFNVHVPMPDGSHIRIWRKKVPGRAAEMRIDRWEKVTVKVSGIPTFEPSRRRSF